MEIATNAVLLAMLLNASEFVRKIDLPLATPLESSNVVAFRIGVGWNQASSDIGCYLAYKGGYEFSLSHGSIDRFRTRDSFTDIQRPGELDKLVGEVRYTQADCLAKVKQVFRNLGYTNVSLLDAQPEITPPIQVRAGIVPRFIFCWSPPDDPHLIDARVEVNASRLKIEHLSLINRAFWGKPWPITFGTTNTLEQVLQKAAPAKPTTRLDLDVHDVSQEYALAYIQAILPKLGDFCSRLGPPFPAQLTMQDISMGESEVAIKRGRVSVSLRVTSGLSTPRMRTTTRLGGRKRCGGPRNIRSRQS